MHGAATARIRAGRPADVDAETASDTALRAFLGQQNDRVVAGEGDKAAAPAACCVPSAVSQS